MKFYLFFYRIGNKTEQLKQLVPHNTIGYISNVLDSSGADPQRRKRHIKWDTADLQSLGINMDLLDLRSHFSKENALLNNLRELGARFITGGHVFVLRQSIYLSSLDSILQQLRAFLTGRSYSGVCLGSDLGAGTSWKKEPKSRILSHK
ncbi:MAG: hypothetical protein AAF944_26145 [Bacteroidota bacterium]